MGFVKKHACTFLALSFFLFVCDFLIYAQGSDVEIYNFDGKVSLIRDTKEIPFKVDMICEKNDSVRTGEDGFLDFSFYSFAGSRVGPSSECILVKKSEEEIRLRLKIGTLLVNMKEPPQDAVFEIEGPLAIASVKEKSQFWVRVLLKDKKMTVIFAVSRGTLSLRLEKSGATVMVPEGHEVEIYEDTYIPSLRPISDEKTKILEKAGTVLIAI